MMKGKGKDILSFSFCERCRHFFLAFPMRQKEDIRSGMLVAWDCHDCDPDNNRSQATNSQMTTIKQMMATVHNRSEIGNSSAKGWVEAHMYSWWKASRCHHQHSLSASGFTVKLMTTPRCNGSDVSKNDGSDMECEQLLEHIERYRKEDFFLSCESQVSISYSLCKRRKTEMKPKAWRVRLNGSRKRR